MDEGNKRIDDKFVEVLPPDDGLKPVLGNQLPAKKANFLQIREKLVEEYHKNAKSLFEKISSKPNGNSVEGIISTALEELIHETDNLLGNELSLLNDGSVRDASVVSVKRSDVLETLSRVAVKKQEIMANAGKVDLNSPVFQVFQAICFENLIGVMEDLKLDNETRQLLVAKWGERMESWDKELKSRVEDLVK